MSNLAHEELFSQSTLVTPRDLVIHDGELVRYFWAIYQDPHTDVRTKFLAATKLADVAIECRRSLELTETDTRLNRLEALDAAFCTRVDHIERIQEQQLELLQSLHSDIHPDEDEDR
jgi:hypothetical protein